MYSVEALMRRILYEEEMLKKHSSDYKKFKKEKNELAASKSLKAWFDTEKTLETLREVMDG
jgi:hypothetical protein